MKYKEEIKELRARTGAAILDCKKVLEAVNGDVNKAIEHLRKMGIVKAEEKMGRKTNNGIIDTYIHPGAQLGVLVEVDCETDFVARNEEFKKFVHDIAMHIAASDPIAISRENFPEAIKNREIEIYKAQAEKENKPPEVIEKIVQGKLNKFYKETCLLEQSFIKNPEITVGEYIKQNITKFGENIVVKRFARFKVGED